MTITEYAVTLARTFMAAEIAMASVNCGAANVTRAQAEKLLGNYFALVEQAIHWTEINHLTIDHDPSAAQRGNQGF
jgi:hypothetical protein